MTKILTSSKSDIQSESQNSSHFLLHQGYQQPHNGCGISTTKAPVIDHNQTNNSHSDNKRRKKRRVEWDDVRTLLTLSKPELFELLRKTGATGSTLKDVVERMPAYLFKSSAARDMCLFMVDKMNPQHQVDVWRQKGPAPGPGTCFAANKTIAAAGGVSVSTLDRMMKMEPGKETIGGLLFDGQQRPNKTVFRDLSHTGLLFMYQCVKILYSNGSDARKIFQIAEVAETLLKVAKRNPVGRPVGSVVKLVKTPVEPVPARVSSRKINCDVPGKAKAPAGAEINCDARKVITTPILTATTKTQSQNHKLKPARDCSKNNQADTVKTLAVMRMLERVANMPNHRSPRNEYWAAKRRQEREQREQERDVNAISPTDSVTPHGWNQSRQAVQQDFRPLESLDAIQRESYLTWIGNYEPSVINRLKPYGLAPVSRQQARELVAHLNALRQSDPAELVAEAFAWLTAWRDRAAMPCQAAIH